MCNKETICFIVTATLCYIGLFTATLLNMIFSIKVPNNNSFKYYIDEDYMEKIKKKFIIDLKFGADLTDKDTYGKFNGDSVVKWRNTTVKITEKEFEIEMLEDIKSENENCRDGYTKCGMINTEDTYLCLKLAQGEKCPVNDIIINDEPILNDFEYKTFELGDRYIHFTHDFSTNYILTGFKIDEKIIESALDSVPFEELRSYNPNIWDYWYIKNVSLTGKFYETKNRTEIRKLVIENEKNKDKINEMNNNMEKNKSALKSLSIAIFVLTTFFPINIGIYFATANKKDCSYLDALNNSKTIWEAICGCIFLGLFWIYFRYSCELCFKGRVIIKQFAFMLLLIFSPIFIGSFACLIMIILKKSQYNDYLSMEYINEFQNGDIFNTLINNYNREFVSLLIAILIFVVYIIILLFIFLVCSCDKDNHDDYSDNEKFV